MSYSITISGHGADQTLVAKVAKDAVRALREPEGASAGAHASGTGPDGETITVAILATDELEEAES